jgi:hypothetical protein
MSTAPAVENSNLPGHKHRFPEAVKIMGRKRSIALSEPLERRLLRVHDAKVILDLDLAELYGVTPKP